MTRTKKVDAPVVDGLGRNWAWIFGLGILFMILGFIGLGMEVGLTLTSILFLGVLLIISGITHLVDAFQNTDWKGTLWKALIALLYIAAGVMVIYDPIMASVVITAVIAYLLIVIGVARIIMAFSLKGSAGWIWLLLAGITAVVLGILILIQWPMSGFWVIGLFIAIELLVTGWTYVFIGLALRAKRNQA
jgi:uncharacterized membrane protein HdeD (DUF308 family)